MNTKQNMQILREDENLQDNFGYYVDNKSTLEKLDIKNNNIDIISKSLDTKCYIKIIPSKSTSQDSLLKVSYYYS